LSIKMPLCGFIIMSPAKESYARSTQNVAASAGFFRFFVGRATDLGQRINTNSLTALGIL
jgi:hypothetical protein